MKTFLALTIVQLFSQLSFGYILPLDLILEKSAALSPNQIISLEQDVIFKEAAAEAVIHETWLIDGDKNLKLTAIGQGDLKESFRLISVYESKNKTYVLGKNKVTEPVGTDFFEKYLLITSVAAFKSYLNALTIPQSVRYSRADGEIAYAVGESSSVGNLKPQFWISQNSFQIKKIRLPSEAEVSFSDYGNYSNKFEHPKIKKVDWSGKAVSIRVRSINTKPVATTTQFSSSSLDQPSDFALSNKSHLYSTIEEFYKRFR